MAVHFSSLLELSDRACAEPPSQRRTWISRIVSDGSALVLSYPVARDHLHGLLWLQVRLGIQDLAEKPDYAGFSLCWGWTAMGNSQGPPSFQSGGSVPWQWFDAGCWLGFPPGISAATFVEFVRGPKY